MKLYAEIASKLIAIDNCIRGNNFEWKERHEDDIAEIMKSAPSGSGIDSGTDLMVSECTPNKLVFSCDFHHMNENGYYDGWTEHKVIVTPSLFAGINIRITGKNRNDIKEYLTQVFHSWLTEKETIPAAAIEGE